MLIPLGTDRPLRRGTVITLALIVVNVGVFGLQVFLRASDPDRAEALLRWGAAWSWDFHWRQLIAANFLHADTQIWHVVFNMLFLWIFGPNLEDRLGRLGFVALYLFGGAAAMGAHVLVSSAPAIGASGAVSALTGAYLVLFPRTLVRVFFLIGLSVVWVPAWWVIGLAIVWDLIAGGMGHGTGIAHAAHLGGTVFGVSTAFVLLWTRLLPREPYDLFSQARQAMRRREIRDAERGFKRRMEHTLSPEKKTDPEVEEHAKTRAEVSRLIAAGDLVAASREYRRLADTYGHLPRGAVLRRDEQCAIATHMYTAGDYVGAAYAFERFLEAYPRDSESAQIKLLLGRINARYLNDPVRAKAVLADAIKSLRDEESLRLARAELDALG